MRFFQILARESTPNWSFTPLPNARSEEAELVSTVAPSNSVALPHTWDPSTLK